MRAERHFILARGTAGLMAGAFLFTNVIAAHAGENAFWAERRGAAHRVKPDESRPGERRSQNPLLAQLPQWLSSSPISREVIPSFPSSGSANQLPTLRSSLPKGDMKQWGWLPELVAPFGNISEIHLSSRPNAPLIIHLQDAHEVEEAQRNLAGLVGTLHANRGISLVGLEGAVGAFDLDPYRSSNSPDLTRGLADAFMKLGYLSGPEAAGIVANKTPTLWGIEDLPLYRDHLSAFQASEKVRAHVQIKVAALSAAADGARGKVYSAELRAIDDHRLAYLAHREPLGDYALALSQSFKGNHASFPNVGFLLESLKRERALDFKEVERERLHLVEGLVQRFSPASLDILVQESLNFRAGRLAYGVYLDHLRSLCRDSGIALDAYGPLNDYISYVLLAERIDANGLLQEMDDLEKTVLMSLAQTADQRRLVIARRDLSLLEKLILHSLTPAEWKTYQTERSGILDLQNTLTQLSGRPVSENVTITAETVAPFEMFCKCAMDRNSALVKNTLNKMRADKTPAAIFVAGGFHTDGVTQILRRENVSYAVVTPRMTKVPDNIRPLDVFARAPLPLEKLLAGDVIHLAYAHLTEARGETVSVAPDGALRQETLHLGWVAIKNAFDSELNNDPDSPNISAFQELTHISKKKLVFQGALSGFLFKANVGGNEKQFKVVMAPKNVAENLFAKNGFSTPPSLKIDLPIGDQTYEVRIFSAEKNTEVEWVKAGYNRLGRYLARSLAALKRPQWLVRTLNTTTEIFDLYRQQMAYLFKQEGLLPHRTGIHLAHAERTTALASIIAERWNVMFSDSAIDANDPRLILFLAAHDLGKLSPHLAKLFLGEKTYARDSQEYQALHDHEEAAFDVLEGSGLKIPEGVVDLFQYVSSIHPDAPALPAYTPDQKLKILAGIGILADIFDAQMDVHRPYKTEQLRQGTLPAPAQMVEEFDHYLSAWDRSTDTFENNLAKRFRQLAVALIQDKVFLQSIETTFFERAVESYQEHFSAVPVTPLDYQERFLAVLSSVRDFQLYARQTPASQWWPALIDQTILKGAEENVRSERLENLEAALSLVVEKDHALLPRPNQSGKGDDGLKDFLTALKEGESFPELSPIGARLLFGPLERSLYRGGVLPDVLERVEPVFRNFFGKRFGDAAARYAARVIGVPFLEDTVGGFKFRHLLRSTLVPLLLGHLFVSLAGVNSDLGLFSAVVVFLTGRLVYVSDHPTYARKDARLTTLTSTVVALIIALWGGFTLMAVLAAYVAALANHILVNAWLNRWLFQKDHAPGKAPALWRSPLNESLLQWVGAAVLPALAFILFPGIDLDVSIGFLTGPSLGNGAAPLTIIVAMLASFISFFPIQSWLMSLPGHRMVSAEQQTNIRRVLAATYVLMALSFLLMNFAGGATLTKILFSGFIVLAGGFLFHLDNNKTASGMRPSWAGRLIRRIFPFIGYGKDLASAYRPEIEPTATAIFSMRSFSDLDRSEKLEHDIRALGLTEFLKSGRPEAVQKYFELLRASESREGDSREVVTYFGNFGIILGSDWKDFIKMFEAARAPDQWPTAIKLARIASDRRGTVDIAVLFVLASAGQPQSEEKIQTLAMRSQWEDYQSDMLAKSLGRLKDKYIIALQADGRSWGIQEDVRTYLATFFPEALTLLMNPNDRESKTDLQNRINRLVWTARLHKRFQLQPGGPKSFLRIESGVSLGRAQRTVDSIRWGYFGGFASEVDATVPSVSSTEEPPLFDVVVELPFLDPWVHPSFFRPGPIRASLIVHEDHSEKMVDMGRQELQVWLGERRVPAVPLNEALNQHLSGFIDSLANESKERKADISTLLGLLLSRALNLVNVASALRAMGYSTGDAVRLISSFLYFNRPDEVTDFRDKIEFFNRDYDPLKKESSSNLKDRVRHFLDRKKSLSAEGLAFADALEKALQEKDPAKALEPLRARFPSLLHPHLEYFGSIKEPKNGWEDFFRKLSVLQITDGCSKMCLHCYESPKGLVRSMPFDRILQLFDQWDSLNLAEAGPNGEEGWIRFYDPSEAWDYLDPLYNANFGDVLWAFHSALPRKRVLLTTRGWDTGNRIGERAMNKIAALMKKNPELMRIRFSLDFFSIRGDLIRSMGRQLEVLSRLVEVSREPVEVCSVSPLEWRGPQRSWVATVLGLFQGRVVLERGLLDLSVKGRAERQGFSSDGDILAYNVAKRNHGIKVTPDGKTVLFQRGLQSAGFSPDELWPETDLPLANGVQPRAHPLAFTHPLEMNGGAGFLFLPDVHFESQIHNLGIGPRAAARSKEAGSWFGNAFYIRWLAWMETPISLAFGQAMARAIAPFFVMGGLALGFPLDLVAVESLLSGTFSALIFFAPHPLLENTHFGNPGSGRSPLVLELTAWTFLSGILLSFSPLWGLSFAVLLTAVHFDENFKRGLLDAGLAKLQEARGLRPKLLSMVLIIFLSLGLIHDSRAESEGSFASENLHGLVSFSSNPDAEKEASRLRRELEIHLSALQKDGGPSEPIKNIVATLQDAVYEQNTSLTRELALSVQGSNSAGPWLKSLAELMVLRERSKEKTFGQGEGSAILNDLKKLQAAVFSDPKWYYGPGKVISDDKVLSMIVDVYGGIRHEPLSLEARTGEMIQLYNLLHELSQKEKGSSALALLTGNINFHFLSVEDARALITIPETPDWLKSIAAEVIERSKSEVGVTEEKQTDGIVSVFLRNKDLKSERDLWPLVMDWAREVLLGTTGTLEERVFNLSPLEAYVLLDVLSRNEPTIPMDPAITAQVRAQLWANIFSGLKTELDRGPSPAGTSIYGDLANLVMQPGGFGQRAFFRYVIESGKRDDLEKILPPSLRHPLSLRIRENNPLPSPSPTGLEKNTITALGFAIPSSVELTQQEILARSLLGGTAEGHLDLWGYSVGIDALRLRVEKDRAQLAAQRKDLARTFGVGSLASVSALAQAAARSHGRRSTEFEQENEIQLSIRTQIELLLALAYDQGKGDPERAQSSVVETVRVYHEAQKMYDDESALMAAMDTGKEIVLEMTPNMLSAESVTLSAREEAQWRRLAILSKVVAEGKLKKHVRLLVPDGVTAREVAPVLKSQGLSLRGYYLTKPKSSFRMEDGKYSVNKFVSWLTEDKGRSSDPGSIDMYLMDRSEWDWDNLIDRIRKNIRLLVDVLPGLVIDATNRLPDDLKRLVAVNVTA